MNIDALEPRVRSILTDKYTEQTDIFLQGILLHLLGQKDGLQKALRISIELCDDVPVTIAMRRFNSLLAKLAAGNVRAWRELERIARGTEKRRESPILRAVIAVDPTRTRS